MKKIIVFFLLSLTFYGIAYSQINNGKFDMAMLAENKIYQYYGKETFEEPKWIRVKNFLTWLDNNKTALNKHFSETYLNITDDTEKLIFAFLGANYISQKTINKMFDFPIKISPEGCYANPSPIYICIEPFSEIEVLNLAIHEATHLLPAVGKANVDMLSSDRLSEEITIFAQLKYALPVKSGKLSHTTRTFFIFADEDTIRKNVDNIKAEYADIVYAATNYSNYDESNILNTKIRTSRSVYQIIQLIFNGINNNYLKNHNNLNDDEIYYLQSPIFQDIKDAMENRLFPNLSEQYDYSSGYLQKILLDNESEILLSFIYNLRKYADKNIPPVPKGYI